MTPRPDNCPDKVSGLAAMNDEKTEIPTIIPTKCRDTARPLIQATLVRRSLK